MQTVLNRLLPFSTSHGKGKIIYLKHAILDLLACSQFPSTDHLAFSRISPLYRWVFLNIYQHGEETQTSTEPLLYVSVLCGWGSECMFSFEPACWMRLLGDHMECNVIQPLFFVSAKLCKNYIFFICKNSQVGMSAHACLLINKHIIEHFLMKHLNSPWILQPCMCVCVSLCLVRVCVSVCVCVCVCVCVDVCMCPVNDKMICGVECWDVWMSLRAVSENTPSYTPSLSHSISLSLSMLTISFYRSLSLYPSISSSLYIACYLSVSLSLILPLSPYLSLFALPVILSFYLFFTWNSYLLNIFHSLILSLSCHFIFSIPLPLCLSVSHTFTRSIPHAPE